ncbi:periplasmic domain protein [Proteus mirabilis]|nr:periplasmic domain protein [Proteus mirabilis]
MQIIAPRYSLFKQHRWEIEEEFEELAKLYEVSTLHPFYCLSMAE